MTKKLLVRDLRYCVFDEVRLSLSLFCTDDLLFSGAIEDCDVRYDDYRVLWISSLGTRLLICVEPPKQSFIDKDGNCL